MSSPLRAAVVGVGYLGAFHAEKYAGLDGVDLIAVVDTNAQRAGEIAAQFSVRAESNYRSLFGGVDCVSLAVPTPQHFAIAADLLQHGVDVLVEKPMTEGVTDGRALVALAEQHRRILQVGHLERFNPAIRALAPMITQPRFIECHRLAQFVDRGTDVDVILDLMIHDLDVILSLVNAEVQSVEAVGVPVLTENVDIANARLRFTNGCIANITASRVAMKRERKIRLFQADTYVSVDYGDKHVRVCRREPIDGVKTITVNELSLEQGDALLAEIEHFVHAVQTRQQPLVDGRTALRALEVAELIRENLETA
ncbi:MAG TPA: Gfo/Idh/MocA family oxidoreductase [Candidatus Acidoferrales bacterium]|nr:Gfo/Idh/MocA family oxidoreductase [Candidatus Acidoferrales bacterium]